MRLTMIVILAVLFTLCSKAQPGTVKSYTKISAAPSSLGNLWEFKLLGNGGVCMIHDMDGDGVDEIAARSFQGPSGYVYIFKLKADGTVKSGYTVLGRNKGGLDLSTTNVSGFGCSIANMGDLNGNGIDDIVIGGGHQYVVIVYLNALGTADSSKQIKGGEYGFNDPLTPGGNFGISVANIGDLDKDGIDDLAVGDVSDDTSRGAVRILFMKADNTVRSVKKISSKTLGFTQLTTSTAFGSSISNLGDLDGDGNVEIFVSAYGSLSSAPKAYTIFLNADGSVKKYNPFIPQLNFPDSVNVNNPFAYYCSAIGDLDGDSVTEVAISDDFYDTLGRNRGRLWIMFLKRDGSAKSFQRIDQFFGNFTASIDSEDRFGSGICPIGDFNKDGIYDICVSACADDDGDPTDPDRNSGALYFLHLNGVPVAKDTTQDTTIGIAPIIVEEGFSIYPNPAEGKINIRSSGSNDVSAIDIVDISGRVVMTKTYTRLREVTVDISAIPSGTYLVHVNGDKRRPIKFKKL